MLDWKNQLYYGDNLPILKEYIKDESIDLIYLDPPFNSNRNYNVLFKDESGQESASQITAFEDTWHWDHVAEATFQELLLHSSAKVSMMLNSLKQFIGTNQVMAYLVMMTARLIELHRVLKPTGSLYLHCDPTASHYLKILLDTIFNSKQFRNEIVWCYETSGKSKRWFSRKHDVIFFYSKSDSYIFNINKIKIPRKTGKHMKISEDKDGRLYEEKTDKKTGKTYKWYFDEGRLPFDYWTDIQFINRNEKQRLGYPTQKPVALLERIIQASSNEGDVILDPFCGCGTTIHAAQKLKRRWIGIDITHLSIGLMKYRLKDAFNLIDNKDYQVIGEPVSIDSARQLAQENRYQFQWWAASLVQAMPINGHGKQGKKGSDKGIDGIINFIDSPDNKLKRVLVQVKSGKINSKDIRDLRGTIDRENAAIGVFITLNEPTRDMKTEAITSGYYKSEFGGQRYPRLQILTIEELLSGKKIDMPPIKKTFKQAQKEIDKVSDQNDFF